MKIYNILIYLIGLFFISCGSKPIVVSEKEHIIVKDTIRDTIIDIQYSNYIKAQYRYKLDSVIKEKDSINRELFVNKYKLNRVNYYTNIVDKKPSQLKYYKGWIKRAIK